MASTTTIENYTCPKCQSTLCDVGEMHVASGSWSKFLDIQGRKLSTVTCKRCSYTELYATESSRLSNVFDLLSSA